MDTIKDHCIECHICEWRLFVHSNEKLYEYYQQYGFNIDRYAYSGNKIRTISMSYVFNYDNDDHLIYLISNKLYFRNNKIFNQTIISKYVINVFGFILYVLFIVNY